WNWEGGTAVVVAPGDTVETLSRKYGVPSGAIMQANNMSSPALVPGQHIVIPRFNGASTAAAAAGHAAAAAARVPARPAPMASGAPAPTAGGARRAGGPPAAGAPAARSVPAAARMQATAPAAPPPATAIGQVHVVAPGETLSSISRRYHKPVTAIAAVNRIP